MHTGSGNDIARRIARDMNTPENPFRALSDEQLLEMLAAAPGEMLEEALVFAKQEAQRRGLKTPTTNTISRREQEEQRQAVQITQRDSQRGLRGFFDIFCVFAGFPTARFISLTISADDPERFRLYSRILFFVCGFAGLAIGDMLFRSAIAPRRSKTVRGLLAALVMIPALLFYVVGSQIGKELQSRHMAVDSVRYESTVENAPTGFGSAAWLMSQEQVRAAFPNAVEFGGPDTLSVQTTAFGRPAVVGFMFKSDILLQIVINFTGNKTRETYQQTHALVEQEYGVLSPPTSTEQFTLASEKRYDRVIVQHLLYSQSGMPIEQVILYRTKTAGGE